ncbi:MAG TPA: (2Fe-2S) ferredoxin domain-containing protein [Myxococcota bacterium]|nr:(2Fe-2S) ferredoxin domain-containing protein [Myxococcota bacterium]
MARFDHIVFVCTKERDRDDPKGSCHHRGGPELLDRMKKLTKEHKLKGRVRVTSSGCLDYCAKGCTVAVFSAGRPTAETWYTQLSPDDAERLFETHVLEGKRLDEHVERSGDDRSTGE